MVCPQREHVAWCWYPSYKGRLIRLCLCRWGQAAGTAWLPRWRAAIPPSPGAPRLPPVLLQTGASSRHSAAGVAFGVCPPGSGIQRCFPQLCCWRLTHAAGTAAPLHSRPPTHTRVTALGFPIHDHPTTERTGTTSSESSGDVLAWKHGFYNPASMHRELGAPLSELPIPGGRWGLLEAGLKSKQEPFQSSASPPGMLLCTVRVIPPITNTILLHPARCRLCRPPSQAPWGCATARCRPEQYLHQIMASCLVTDGCSCTAILG